MEFMVDEEYELYTAMEDQPEAFTIDTDAKADWALKVIKQETEDTERMMKIADEHIDKLKAQKEDIQKGLDRRIGYLKGLLYRYFETVPHKETKTQEQYKLLDGSLVFKKPSQKMAPDREKLLAYVKANNLNDFVKVKEDVDWAAYKKECEIVDGKVVNVQTGDLLPEDVITVEEEPGEFVVKF